MKNRKNRPQPRPTTLAKLTRALGGGRHGLERLEDRTLLTAAPILVTRTEDDASIAGTLRWAVNQANAAPGADVIQFNIPGGLSTVHLGSKLTISDAVTIDGTTEPGYADSPLVWLDGGGAGHTDFGLSLEGGNSTVRGLGFSNFNLAGIDVRSGGNLIGGGAAGQGNVIVNSSTDGILVESGAGNVVQGNLIGSDAGGNRAENQRYGVLVTGTADQTRVLANYVGYNQVAGIGIDGSGDVDVVGNYIGLGRQTLNGAEVFVPMGNGAAGIYVTGQFAGRDVYVTGNVVVLSDANGITLDAASGVHVTGNKIGTDPAGNYADGQFGNFGDAVHIDHGSTGNVIGGTAPGAGNVITGSIGDGVRIMDSTNNVVAGNSITQNFGAGVAIGRGSGNTVADGNSIYANYGVAIDLMNFSGTGNDTLWFQGPGFDPATAPASYVAEPTVTSVRARGAQTVVRGSFDAVPGQTYVIRVYASQNRYEADFGNGLEYFGEAQTYLGSVTVTATGSSARFAGAYNLPAGMNWLTATVTDAAGNTSEVSGAFAPSGTEPVVATTLGSSLNPSVIGQNVTLTAHVTIDGADATDGSVLFMDGTTLLGAGTRTAAGVWTLDTASLAVGSHDLQAVYVDADGLASDQPGALTQTVAKASSNTTLTSDNLSPIVGNAVLLTAHVDVTTGVAQATGTVKFFDRGVLIGSATLDADGSATLSYAFTSAGDHSLTAAYSGNGDVETSTSDAVHEAVAKASTQTTVSTSPSSSTLGQTVTLTATVTVLDSPLGATGLVAFYDGGNFLGNGTLSGGVATFSTAALAGGDHTITAVYAGDAAHQTSTSDPITHTVVVPAPVSVDTTTELVTSDAGPVVGTGVTLTATVTPNSGTTAPTGLVHFTAVFADGSTLDLGETAVDASGVATLANVSFANAGAYAVTATYVPADDKFVTSGASLTENVRKATTTTSLAESAATSNGSQAVTFTATVGTSDSPLVAGGTVTFYDGGNFLGTGTLSATGVATLTVLSLGKGVHTIAAVYGGSDTHQGSTSNSVTHTVSVPFVASGHTLRDTTGNGLSADDTALGGVTVKIFKDSNNNGVLDSADAVVSTVVTDGTGLFSLTLSTTGRYFAQEVTPTGYIQTAPVSGYYTFTASANDSTTSLDFSNWKHCDCADDLVNITYLVNGSAVGDLRGNTHPGDVVQVVFTVPAGHMPLTLSLVSYTAPSAVWDASVASQQKIWEQRSGTFGPGTYTLTVNLPDTFYQVDFVCGPAIDQLGPIGSNIFYSAQDRLLSADNSGTVAYVPGSSSLSGFVYNDLNNNGVRDANEPGLSGVKVVLTGTDDGGNVVNRTVTSDSRGRYAFVNVLAGTYNVTETQPSGYLNGKETPTNTFSSVRITANPGSKTGYNFGEVQASKLSGYVYVDRDNDGLKEAGETGLSGVTISLKDSAGNVVATTTTDSTGAYTFTNVMPGTYTLVESQPAKYVDGIETAGSLGGDASGDNNTITAIPVGVSQTGTGYNFGELPESFVCTGETATIGFWQNKNGQNLIKSFNGSQTSKVLASWLANTFPNLYGAGSVNSLVGKTNADVATLFTKLFSVSGQKLDAQVLGVALAVYATTNTLGGTAAAKYGFTVDAIGTGHRLYNIGTNGAAFGVSNNTNMEVLDILAATDARAVNGVLYNGNTGLRNMANNVFSGINQQGDI